MLEQNIAGTILLIEDDLEVAELVRESLSELDRNVVHVTNGKAAYAWLEHNHPQLIVLDYSLPDMTGAEFVTQMDKLPPFIVTTGAGDEKIAVSMMKRGAQDYLVKDIHFLDNLPVVVKRLLKELTAKFELADMQRKLRESEERYHLLFNNMTEGFALHELVFDENGEPCDYRFLDANRAFEELTGLHREDFIGRTQREFLPAEDSFWFKTYSKVALTGEAVHLEHYSPPLRRHYQVYSYCPAKNQFAVIFSDITARKQADTTLRQSEERLREVLENSLAASYKRNPNTNEFDYYSPVFTRLSGYAPGEMETLPLETALNMIHPDDKPEVERVLALALSGPAGLPHQVEYRFKHKDGHYRWFHDQYVVLQDANNQPQALIGSVSDITERRHVEEALKNAEEKFRLVFMSSPDVYFLTTLGDGRIIEVNPAFQDAFGYTHEEAIGRTSIQLGIYADPDDRVSLLAELQVKGHLKNKELKGRKKDGQEITILLTVNRMVIDHQEYILGVISDITERKRTEVMLNARLTLLDYAASHSLSELLQKTLDQAGIFTYSPLGFYHFVESDQKTLSLQAWSTRTIQEYCKAEGYGSHYSLDQAGVWVDCVYEKKPVIHNDYASLPHRKGLPEGHAQVIRELVVPILREEKVVAILGVGNKPVDYNESDIAVVNYFADIAWEVAERKRTEEDLKKSHELLENLARLVPGVIYQYRLYPDGHSAFPYSSPGINDIYEVTPTEVQEDATRFLGACIPKITIALPIPSRNRPVPCRLFIANSGSSCPGKVCAGAGRRRSHNEWRMAAPSGTASFRISPSANRPNLNWRSTVITSKTSSATAPPNWSSPRSRPNRPTAPRATS